MSKFPYNFEAARKLLEDAGTSATVLMVIVVAAYGEDVFGDPDEGLEPVDPVVLWAAIEQDFNVSLPDEVENKINALRLAVDTDAFYHDLASFNAVCGTLTDGDLGDAVDGSLADVTMGEILWAVFEVQLNRDNPEEFSHAIGEHIQEVMRSESAEGADEEYWQGFVEDCKADLQTQLQVLGVPGELIDRAFSGITGSAGDDAKVSEDVGAVGGHPQAGL